MKKILFIFLIFVIKLSAYEYLYAITSTGVEDYFFDNSDGNIRIKALNPNTGVIYLDTYVNYNSLSYIKYGNDNNQYTISPLEFNNIYKNDLIFLNDLYSEYGETRNKFLNYLYNDSYFNNNNYINYENYELFYNEDGLAVESKVDGVYKGLYDDIGQSGILYNSIGEVVLVDGVEPSFLTKQWLKLQNKVINPLLSVFSISNIWKNILCVVVILASLRMIIRYAFKAFLIRLYSKRIKHYENTITRIENA